VFDEIEKIRSPLFIGGESQSVDQTNRLLAGNLVSRLDVVQLEVERERLRADQESALRELPAAQRKLAAVVGGGFIRVSDIAGTIDLPLPQYDLDRTREVVLEIHLELRSAHLGVDKARLKLRREQAQPIPNVTVGAAMFDRTKTSPTTGRSASACRFPS